MSPSRFIFPSLMLFIVSQGCLYDPDQPCGRNQYFQNDKCLCVEGMILNETDTGCRPCGRNEFAAGALCVCANGYVRATEDSPCEPVPEALGRECDPETNPCTDPTFPYCAVPKLGTPYCTKPNCTANPECPGGYGCQIRTSPTFCERSPSGLGQACSSNDQCAGFEADYCETFRAKVCLVNDCAGPEVTCYGGAVCCDWSPLSYPLSLCVPPESFEDGACPLGGTLVEE